VSAAAVANNLLSSIGQTLIPLIVFQVRLHLEESARNVDRPHQVPFRILTRLSDIKDRVPARILDVHHFFRSYLFDVLKGGGYEVMQRFRHKSILAGIPNLLESAIGG
jgi:hypothetical protein